MLGTATQLTLTIRDTHVNSVISISVWLVLVIITVWGCFSE
jgi:hypothetical protein